MKNLPGCLRLAMLFSVCAAPLAAQDDQPLAANVARVLDALDLLGRPLDQPLTRELRAAIAAENGRQLQALIASEVMCTVIINPVLSIPNRD